MIGSLRGSVIDRGPGSETGSTEVTIEVAGIGYRVTVTASTLSRLGQSGEQLVHIHHHHWEADQRLFGFATREERDAFEGLLTAHKVGPALALAIIATYPPTELALVLANDDIEALCAVPGVGKKTAQRLLVDLKSTLVLPVIDVSTPGASTDSGNRPETGPLADVREALSNLGYGSDEIRMATAELSVNGGDPGDMLKQALRVLAGS